MYFYEIVKSVFYVLFIKVNLYSPLSLLYQIIGDFLYFFLF